MEQARHTLLSPPCMLDQVRASAHASFPPTLFSNITSLLTALQSAAAQSEFVETGLGRPMNSARAQDTCTHLVLYLARYNLALSYLASSLALPAVCPLTLFYADTGTHARDYDTQRRAGERAVRTTRRPVPARLSTLHPDQVRVRSDGWTFITQSPTCVT